MTKINHALEIVRQHGGSVPAIRVSTAASGRWSYWGTVPYTISERDGSLYLEARGCAKRDRRSQRLAMQDGEELARLDGAVFVGMRGPAPRGCVRHEPDAEAIADAIIRWHDEQGAAQQ